MISQMMMVMMNRLIECRNIILNPTMISYQSRLLTHLKQELSLKRLIGRVEERNTTLYFIFQYLVLHCKINPRARTNSRLYKIFQQKLDTQACAVAINLHLGLVRHITSFNDHDILKNIREYYISQIVTKKSAMANLPSNIAFYV